MKYRTLFILVAGLATASAVQADDDMSGQLEFFEKRVRPILADRCYSCHSSRSKLVQGGLKVDSKEELYKGGDTGKAIVPGKPEESLLIQAVQFKPDADFKMPPKGKLPQREIDVLVQWVKRGGYFPKSNKAPSNKYKGIDLAKARQFWSFKPLEQHAVPPVKRVNWPRQKIDYFLLAAMEHNGLQPTPEPSKSVLLRRLSFDLTGLPPTPEELQEFLADKAPDAYERQVERLLRSPHFGERWARLWLDLARYTDRTASWLDSIGEPHLYRDWVVTAMNQDMPYDQFVTRQLATDLMPDTGPEDSPALGYLGLSPNYWKELQLPCEIIKVIVADEWEERVDAVSRTFLGLTVACARCHDHKFDPISQRDYYALAGVFASCRISERPTLPESQFAPVRAARKKVKEVEEKIKGLRKKKPVPEKEIKALQNEIAKLKKTPNYNTIMAPGLVEESLFVEPKGKTSQNGTKLVYKAQPRDLPLFVRGNPNRPGPVVPRGFLNVLSTKQTKPFEQGSGRLELARAITKDASQLTARVIVNRIWLIYFGRGLVKTPSNFGNSGARPTHPNLLDDLAIRFVQGGWSLKKLHREIVLSAAYRQSSQVSASVRSKDVNNEWYARMSRRRLDVEAWRDAMLVASGELNVGLGGPSVDLTDAKNLRRTLYGTIHRREMSTMLLTHDFPDPTAHSPMRRNTTTALQGLYALNGPLILQRAEALTRRLASEHPADVQERIKRAYALLFGRQPSERELALGSRFTSGSSGSERDAWIQYAQVLLASNEFLFVD